MKDTKSIDNNPIIEPKFSGDFEVVQKRTPEEIQAIEQNAINRRINVSDDLKALTEAALSNEPELRSVVSATAKLIMEHEAGRGSGASVKKDEECFYVVREMLRAARELQFDIVKMAGTGDRTYQYTGKHWKFIIKETLKAMLPIAAYKAGVKYSQAFNPEFIDDLYRQLLTLAYAAEPLFSSDEVKVNLNNTTLVINGGNLSLIPHDKLSYFKYFLPYDYDVSAKCPTWLSHLDLVIPDRSAQAVLQEFIGWCFIPHSVLNPEAILFLTGDGSNGKSTVQKVIIALLGKQNCSEKTLSDLSRSANSRFELIGKLANIASETDTQFASAIFKTFASGEAVEVKQLYHDTITLILGAKHIYNLNERPKNVELTKGFFRRFLEIPFNVNIEGSKKILNYEQVLYKELPGILNWVIEGIQRLMKNRDFTYSETVEKAKREFLEDSDSVLSFIRENEYVKSTTNFISTSILHDAYINAVGKGSYPVSAKRFSQRLEKMGFVKERRATGRGFYIKVGPDDTTSSPENLPF